MKYNYYLFYTSFWQNEPNWSRGGGWMAQE